MSKKNVEWEWKKLGDVCEIVSGRNQKAVEVPNGKYPIYGSGGEMGRANSFICPAGCTIVGRKGSINNPIFVNEPFWNVDTAFGFSPKKNCNSFFLFYFCKSFDFYSMNKGTTIPSLVKADLLEISIPIPPLDEQERIVKVLDDAFEKIDTIKTTAETNLQNAKDLFQTTLANELAITDEKIKQGWSNSTLKDSCTKIVDGTHHSPINTTKGDYQYITAKNIRKDGIDLSNITYVAKDIHEEIYARCNPIKGDVLLIKDGATTGIAVINNLDYEFSLLSSVALLKTDSKRLNAQFLVFILNSDNLQKQMHGKMDGAAITRLTLVKIKELQIPLPPLPIQKQIVAKLDSLSEKVKQLESNYKQVLADCDELKKSILKKAFNGEL